MINNQRSKTETTKRQTQAILPPPHILKQYEEVSPGTMERLITMAEMEQVHRQDWEYAYLRHYNRSYILGQICSLFTIVAIIIGSIVLINKGEHGLAVTLIVAGFTTIAFSIAITLKTRKFEKRPKVNFEDFAAKRRAIKQ